MFDITVAVYCGLIESPTGRPPLACGALVPLVVISPLSCVVLQLDARLLGRLQGFENLRLRLVVRSVTRLPQHQSRSMAAQKKRKAEPGGCSS